MHKSNDDGKESV